MTAIPCNNCQSENTTSSVRFRTRNTVAMSVACADCGWFQNRVRPAEAMADADSVEAAGLDSTGRTGGPYTVADVARARLCTEHPAYEADYCPVCGTARVIGGAVR